MLTKDSRHEPSSSAHTARAIARGKEPRSTSGSSSDGQAARSSSSSRARGGATSFACSSHPEGFRSSGISSMAQSRLKASTDACGSPCTRGRSRSRIRLAGSDHDCCAGAGRLARILPGWRSWAQSQGSQQVTIIRNDRQARVPGSRRRRLADGRLAEDVDLRVPAARRGFSGRRSGAGRRPDGV